MFATDEIIRNKSSAWPVAVRPRVLHAVSLSPPFQVTRALSDSLDTAAKIYEAMNAQLKEELPQLNALAWRLLHECIANFVQLATQMSESLLQELRSVLQVLLFLFQILTSTDTAI